MVNSSSSPILSQLASIFHPMSDLHRTTRYTLAYLVEDIRHGRIGLPDIQRPFVWGAAKVRDLFDSMYRGYPVGTLLFWETGAEAGIRQIDDDIGDVPQLAIVDGQQRLTSLYAVLTGREVMTKSYRRQRITIAFSPQDERFEVSNPAIRNNAEFIPDIAALWASYRSTVRQFLARLSESRAVELTEEERDELDARLDRVRDLRNFSFQVIEITDRAAEEQVAEIFVRTNSKGVTLNQGDFILTLMSVYWDKGRHQLEAFCRSAVEVGGSGPSARNHFIQPSPTHMLRAAVGLAFRRGRLSTVYNILRGKDLDTGHFSAERRMQQFDVLKRAQDDVLDLTNWHEYLKCLTRAGFRSSRMISSQNAIIYTYILWLIGRIDMGLDLSSLQRLIARWFFMSHTTGRYTNSPETQIERDLARISSAASDGQQFCDLLDSIVDAEFTNDYWQITLPNHLDGSSAKSPQLCAYWAALILLDAESLLGRQRVQSLFDPVITSPRSLERHHLFPKAYLATLGITDRKRVNAIANMAFVDWPDNLSIGSDPPEDYWPRMVPHLSPLRLKSQTYHHALPVGWEQLDYPEFIEKRRLLIARVIKDGFQSIDDGIDTNKQDVLDLLTAGESQTLEFKSTARYSLKGQRADKAMEHVIVKTVCGFLNADGGTLLIGVDDEGKVLGLEADFSTLGRKRDNDGFELFLRQRLDSDLSIATARVVTIRFETIRGHEICMVSVSSSGKPVFSKPMQGGNQPSEFWVRTGNATNQMHGYAQLEYIKEHWG